ncbi:F-box domain-containing protein [Caenorhabditis elegans]|uniref:F-box domain-containing protein n=1 Tax=Caenorhabditis elegans TaxID=6239 RepID=Q9N5X2_CAEEL|nr:F-box domain-containing protein [Caenorhabditis elegans]CCD67051.1 F-box domain-containing protein [Caenorhabditis elegans]|eukprot:NP_497513.1 F-box A protein [Caenorhabditis elegans]
MPLEISDEILSKLPAMDLLSCRKVCKSLRSAVDQSGNHLNRISFDICNDFVAMDLNGSQIKYTDVSGTAYVTYKGRETKIEEDNFMRAAFNDLASVLKNVKKFVFQNYSKVKQQAITSSINDMLENKCIAVESVVLYNFPHDDILNIISSCQAEVLKDIVLWHRDGVELSERITCLDQWKKARTLHCRFLFCDLVPIEHFFHFEEFSIQIDNLSMPNAIKIRDDLMNKTTFKTCTISTHHNVQSIELARIFQPDYMGDIDYNIKYSNNTGTFEISFKSSLTIRARFVIKKC